MISLDHSDSGDLRQRAGDILAAFNAHKREETVLFRGRSMEPRLYEGDRLKVRLSSDDPRVGDIVVFSRDDRFIVHRLLRVRRAPDGTVTFVTKGDNSRVADAPFGRDQLLGVVAVAIRDGKPLAAESSARSRLIAERSLAEIRPYAVLSTVKRKLKSILHRLSNR